MSGNRGLLLGSIAGALALIASGLYYFSPRPIDSSKETEPVYDYSLKVDNEKIKGYRNPAAQKKYQTTVVAPEEKQKSIESSSKRKSSHRKAIIQEAAPVIVNSSPVYNSNSDSGFRSSPSVGNSHSSAPSSGSGSTASGHSSSDGTSYFSNTPLPQSPTNEFAPNADKKEEPLPPQIPFLKGKVKPLDGIISNYSTDFLIKSAYANTCTNPRILLMDLTEFSILLDNPITAAEIESSAAFDFDPLELKLDIRKPQRYMLQTLGCDVNYQRIISSFYEDQDLDKITTLVSKVINTKSAGVVNDVSPVAISNLYSQVQKKSSPSVDFEEVYKMIEDEGTLKDHFKDTFYGVPPIELTVAAPDINEVKIHSALKEKGTFKYEVKAFHWNPVYQIGYEWWVDGELKGSTASWDYIPSANSKPEQVITLVLGQKNINDQFINRSTPYHEINFDVTVSDDFPTMAPAISLNSAYNNPGNTRSIKFDLNTGENVEGIYNHCETFDSLALTETAGAPSASDFTFSCNAGPVQIMPYNIQNPQDGPVTVYLWARDANGKISQLPSSINLEVDTSKPIIEFIEIVGAYEADKLATFKWLLTEMNAKASQNFKLEFFNGSTWEVLPEVPLTNGPHTNSPFQTDFHVPNILINNAKMRVSYADIFGHETIKESETFTILKPVLSSTPLVMDMGQVQNKQTSAEYTLIFTNSGGINSKTCSAVVLSGPQASEFTIARDDCQGKNIGATGCEVAVKAHPLSVGPKTANLTISCQNDNHTASLKIESKNNSPIVNDISLSLEEDKTQVVSLGPIKDEDGDSLSYFIINPPVSGTLNSCAVDGDVYKCTYVPNAHFNGSDYFKFKSFDGSVYSNIGNATLTVTAVNDAPMLSAAQDVLTSEDIPLNFNLNSGSDIENSPLSYIIVSPPSVGTLNCIGGTNTSCTYTPDLDYNGITTFTYKVNDGELDSPLSTVTITVNPVNDPPVMGLDQNLNAVEDTNFSFTLNIATDVDLPAQAISYKLVTLPTKGSLSDCLNDTTYLTDRNCLYTPHPNANGTDTFTFIAYDGVTDAVSAATVTINIAPVNDAPTVTSTQSVTTAEDTAVTFDLNAGSDIEGSSLNYLIISPPAQGTLNCIGGTSRTCTYTPPQDFDSTTTFTYKVNDGDLDSNIATVTINVTSENDAPVMGSNQTLTTDEDTSFNLVLNAATDVDIPAQTISYKLITAPTKGILSGCINLSSYTTGRNCIYTPSADANGTDTFTFRANDGLTDAATVQTVTITINPINDAPTLVATQSVSTNEDTPLSFNLNLGSDIEGNTLTYIKLTNPSSGTLTCTGGTSRACNYTPVANFNGSVSFTYKVNDGLLDSNTAIVTITVDPVNDPPVMAANQVFVVNDNTDLIINLSPATDIDGGALTYKIVGPPTNGTLTNCITTSSYGTDLSCTYKANTNFNGTDTFTFIAFDTFANALAPATVTITVSDKTPPSAPVLLTRTSPEYTKVTPVTFTAGTCSDQVMLLVNTSVQPTAGATGWQTCTTAANAITASLTTTQGAQTLKVWAKDSNGNVSPSSTDFTIYYDTVLPTLALTTPPIQKGGAAYSFTWTATESYTMISLNFTVEFFDGTSWSAVGTTPSTSGPLSSTAFSHAWTVPSLNTSGAQFRVSFTDRAGNSRTMTSGSFTIDSIAPNLTIATPALNSYHKSSATITGACETGRDIEFSGGIQSTFTIACTSGTYSQLVNFSNGDGNKLLTVKQIDLAGNITTVSRNFIRDEIPPVMAKTTGNSPDFTRLNQPNAWGGTCEGNYTINVSGSETTSFACTAGTWSWTPSAKTADGTYNYNLIQTDGAGNVSSPPLTLSWTRDATAPTLTTTTPVVASAPPDTTKAFINNLSVLDFNGTCEGTNPIKITLAAATMATMSCSSSTWSWSTPAASADGVRNYIVQQTDPAGNISKITYSWTRDTTGPGLKIDNPSIKNNINTAVFTGNCETGLPVQITGTETTSVTCPSGTWTFTTASKAVDGDYTFTFKQVRTVSPFNSTTVTGKWIRKTTAPTISSFTTSASNPSRSSYIPVDLNANSNHTGVLLTHVCIKSDDSSKPAMGDSCFIGINSPVIGLALSNILNLNDHFILMGWTPKAYQIYPWVLDEAGNISNLSASGAGTLNIDKVTNTYDPGIPPTVWDVLAANVGTAPLPPTRMQGEVPAGTDVYIRWKTNDNNPLPAGAVVLSYTTDEINFNGIASGIDPYNNNCGIILAANEGCYKWTGGSPLSISYKVRVRVTDSTDISTQLISNPTNMGPIKIIAGNTESGLNGSAQTAMFYTRRNGYSDPGTLVVTEDGKFFFADYKRGILTIDQADGKQKIFIPATGTSSGDGGAAVNATLNYPVKMALDYQNRLLILDRNRIRRVDLNLSTPTIETIIGGGSDTSDTVNNPLNVSMYAHGTNGGYEHTGQAFFATPNGDIYFQSEYHLKSNTIPTYRVRIYKEATGQVISKHFKGMGLWSFPTEDLSKCRLMHPLIQFNPNNSQLTGVALTTYQHDSFTGCNQYNDRYSRAYFDPETFDAIPPKDGSHASYAYIPVTGMDGNAYITASRHFVDKANLNGGYVRILGQGTVGECIDGTPATSCMVDLQNFYVTATGKMYFTDRGVIRTIDENGNVKTLFGQRLTYGDNVNALNARFSDIHKVFRLDNGKIIANDVGGSYLKEFSIEGNITIIAGDGAFKTQDHVNPAATQSMLGTTWTAVNKANGDVFATTLNDQYGNYAKLNRSTGKWEQIIGNSAGTHYISADGIPGLSVDSYGNDNRGLILGYGNNDLVISRMKHYPTPNNRYEDFMIKLYKSTDLYRQSHLAGVEGYPADNNPRRTCDVTTAVSAATCEMPYWDTFFHFQWDSVNNRWITANVYGGNQREIYEFKAGMIKRIGYTGANIDDSFVYVKLDGVENFYYCNGGRIRRYNLTTQQELGLMPWSMGNLSCRGRSMDFNPTNRSIIFPFEQNGLYGVGEYYLP